ncbi:SpoVK/Ycf46/Vps4 family AAA+-type ATPase [Spinactinospora alkalitolerans]|uniref:SpoVK/Ycf46/Vps4 family AAA+-type ATPase n=1 Tax=Spinactinospora alkalitolerans TaxID=687207 RepID=A0A852TSB1_9ACTN|nr:AAA family ATPase [Spinactinospora alkalitolerans]NYE46425.1 SpoVK/Ycf46/Vps4 family AAA+-type ATPase [Spinactinospora alkalitolerans]
MPRNDEPRTTGRPARTPPLQRLRDAYSRQALRSRLAAGFTAVTVAALLAFLVDVPVLAAIAVTVMVLAVFAALMRSSAAVAAALVCVAWIAVAYPLFQIPLAGAPVVLVLLLLPLLVSLAATRIRAFPVWHTTLLALLIGLILGLAVALTSMLTDAVPPALGVTCTVAAAGAALLWRAVAGYRLHRETRPRGDAPTAPDPGAAAAQGRGRSPAGRGGTRRTGTESAAVPVPVDEALAELEDMIGLDPVKQQVRAIAASIEAARLRADAGYAVDKPLRHLVFSGPPGTGKTSVARTLATVFHSFGLLPSPNVVEAQRADLVGEYLGATAIKTNELVDRALGGVLFIDEAYSLVNDGDGQSDRFGNEAVQTLLKRAEDDRDRLVVILAGYDKEMDRFLASNPGLASRFATRVTFPSYRPEELQRIAEHQFDQRGDLLDEQARPALRSRFDQAAQRGVVDELGNGRFVRSLVEKTAEARDVRVVTSGESGRQPAPEELVTIRAADVATAYDQLTERLPGFTKAPDVDEALAELDAMIGLDPVKRQVRSIAAQLQMAKLREGQGLPVQPPMRHFVFVGPPGTGKTTVARILGRVFAALGLLNRADVVEAGRADLVGEHLGATAVKTNKLVDRALGGVLFIDEAYALVNPGYSGGDAFGSEAIQTLLKRAEDDRSRLVIVLAGYPAEMDRFLASNSGLSSRFNVRVAFPSYTPEELTEIADRVAAGAGDAFDEQAREDLHQIFGHVCEAGWIDEFGNGRFARSLFEKACSYRDLRVSEELGDAATAEELTLVTSADLRQAYGEVTQG